jgi:hypothetical protein
LCFGLSVWSFFALPHYNKALSTKYKAQRPKT